ncbi:MAG TPA: di-heme oxidoredictase family protein [Thermoanaerobaculia bacterium]|jgi:cytochrome c peroxidase|nr:di-heme oxidoredictase family protein [Thermoanaerobaculia bacterium]
MRRWCAALASVVAVSVGERPAIEMHLDETAIEEGRVPAAEVLEQGRRLFAARFNTLDGQGRPATTGHGVPRAPTQPPFIRTSGPDANSCAGCHSQPRVGGAGEFAVNVFVLANERDPVLETVDSHQSNERNTTSLMGVGLIELLAREMSAELAAARAAATAEAKRSGAPARRELRAKGVWFGAVTVMPDGRVDPREIEGVDWDLVVRPFHQKGAVASLRDFTNTALNQHHGMQSVERAGPGLDLDGDGFRDELTVGDVTALVLFQAALDTPGRLLPAHPLRRAAAEHGEQLFAAIGCGGCHLPLLVLDDARFTEPGPYNPQGNLRPQRGRRAVVLDLARQGIGPRPERLPDGRVAVRAFTDLKRHELNDEELRHFANEEVPQGSLAGVQPSGAFTEVPKARPRSQFLTRRLWDAGNSDPYGHRGDLTTLTEAIHFHGGEARAARDAFLAQPEADQAAIIEFLKTLQILPEGAAGLVVDEATPPR